MFDRLELQESPDHQRSMSPGARLGCGLAALAVSAGLAYALLTSDKAMPEMAERVMNNLEKSGVENPVTAVLLNFRSYDTLLEIGVLLIVAVAMLPLTGKSAAGKLLEVDRGVAIDPTLGSLLRWLVPLAMMLGGYLLWTGSYHPGGAFQAGAVIAGGCVALKLSGRYRFNWQPLRARLLLSIGLVVFIVAGALCAGDSAQVLEYPVAQAGVLILVIEVAATVTISAILLLLFTGLQDRMPVASGKGEQPK